LATAPLTTTPARSTRSRPRPIDFRFRPLRPADLDAVMAMEAECFAPADRFSRRRYRHLLCHALPRGTAWGLLAINGRGDLVGVTLFLLRRGARLARLYSVSVAPAARGRGLASQLITRAARSLRRRGIDRIGLEVRERNTAARSVYERLGFSISQRFEKYYADGETGIRYTRRI